MGKAGGLWTETNQVTVKFLAPDGSVDKHGTSKRISNIGMNSLNTQQIYNWDRYRVALAINSNRYAFTLFCRIEYSVIFFEWEVYFARKCPLDRYILAAAVH